MVRFQTFEQFHGKKHIGSTRIRVHNLIKHWPEAALYKYGEKPDVLIFQKVYCTQDYKFPKYYDGGLKILDICDPDWLEGTLIRETVDAMDAVVVPTKPLADFITQLTDKPVKVIKDRFDLDEFPKPLTHEGDLKKVVWFGYHHNAEVLKTAVLSLFNRGIQLIVISDQDPQADRWAGNSQYHELYTFYKYNQNNIYGHLQEADVCVLPQGWRPKDRFKSENKTVIAQLCGLPVVKTAEELDKMITPEERNAYVKKWYSKVRQEHNVRKSVEEYKELIGELQRGKVRS